MTGKVTFVSCDSCGELCLFINTRTCVVCSGRLMDVDIQNVMSLVHSFLMDNPEWVAVDEDTGGAGLCADASRDFIEWCYDNGIELVMEVVEVQGTMGFNTYANHDCHWVVMVEGRVVVDLTARQFNESLSFPHVWVRGPTHNPPQVKRFIR